MHTKILNKFKTSNYFNRTGKELLTRPTLESF